MSTNKRSASSAERGVMAALAKELGRTRPFRSVSEGPVLAILRTAAVIRRTMAHHFEAVGLTLPQYNVLRILRGTPQGLPTLEIRRRMIEEAAGITRLLDKLEAAGWIERDRSQTDRRQVRCRITANGLDLLRRVDPSLEAAHIRLVTGLDEGEMLRLVGLLLKVIAGTRLDGA